MEADLDKPKILCIDDEDLLRNSVKKILERAGFEVETAFDYPSAREQVEKSHFHLLLVDLVLPKMNGIDLIKNIQKEFSEFNPVIIFMTGEPNLETAVEAIRLGAIDYLEKPQKPPELVQAIRNALLRKDYMIEIADKEKNTKFTLDKKSLFETPMDENFKKDLRENLDEIHTALKELKKKYGESFNEDQRRLLNILAKNSTAMRKKF